MNFRKFILSLHLLCLVHIALPQTCLPGGIVFDLQSEIDNFQSNYPGCTEIGATTYISGPLITDLSGLSSLTSFDVSLRITGCTNLQDLTGLDNVVSIGGVLEIEGNGLTSLTGLDNLQYVGSGQVDIQNNSALGNLTGLGSLDTIGFRFDINDNDAMTSLAGMTSLEHVGAINIEDNQNLISLSGLDNLQSASGRLYIYENPSLQNLDGLGSLISVGADVNVWNNASLTSLTGLGNLSTVGGGFAVTGNGSLTTLNGVNNLSSITGGLIIQDNDLLTDISGLSNLNTIMFGSLSILDNALLTNLNGLQNIPSIGGSLNIDSNALLSDLSALDNLTAIGGNLSIFFCDDLTNLTGLDNIDPATISNLSLAYSSGLSACDVQSICDYLAGGGASFIVDNAPGCNSAQEVEAACMVTSVDGTDREIVNVFPNPAYHEVMLPGLTGMNQVEIINVTGRLRLAAECLPGKGIDVSYLPTGIYFIRFVGNTTVLRFTKL